MPMSRLTAVITALMITGWSHETIAGYDLHQLQVIEQLILDKDCGALLRYLKENPEVSVGDDELARELRAFADNVDGRLIQCLSFKSEIGAGSNAPDLTPTLKWLEAEARRGRIQAQIALGVAYAYGQGVARNKTLGYMWLDISATNGDVGAKKRRDSLGTEMTKGEIARAESWADTCLKTNYQTCG